MGNVGFLTTNAQVRGSTAIQTVNCSDYGMPSQDQCFRGEAIYVGY